MARPDARPGALRTGPLPVERFFQFSLLGLVASGYLAVAGSAYLDVPTVVLTGCGILLRALELAGLVKLNLTGRAATIAAIAYGAFFPIDYFFLSRDFLSSTVHLVFFLAVVKILTARTNRDNVYIAVIAFLELLAAAIVSINLNFFLCLALFLMFAIAALTSGEIRRSMHHRATSTARAGLKSFHSRLAMLSVWIALGILTLTAGMFFLLPRTADAALSQLISHRIRVPGFSDHVTLGDFGEFKNSSRPVMHIAVYGNEPMGSVKWRGDVLSDFDGRVWSHSNLDSRGNDVRVIHGRISLGIHAGQQRSYLVEFTDLESRVLFFAGSPEIVERLPEGTRVESETGSFRLPALPVSGFHYYAASVLPEPPETAAPLDPAPILGEQRKSADTELPERLDPRIAWLAKSMVAGASTDLGRARALEQRLRHDYSYTLELPKWQSQDPLADFLFTRRKGNCEYFASSMAVMLRTLDIPSRLATGFLGGVYNPVSDLWLVRASDAHSWVEAWIPGHGWTTFDPTPPDLSTHSLTFLSKAGLYLDAAETFWQQWVVGYDPNRQGNLADRIEQTSRRVGLGWMDSFFGAEARWVARTKAWIRRFGWGLVVALVAGYWLWSRGPKLWRAARIRRRVERMRRGEASMADATVLYTCMLQVLGRQGYEKPAWFTPVEFARALAPTPHGAAVEEFTAAYNAMRFGGRTETAPRLSMLLDELERPARRP
jgi:protein-glutamine gamma-glutamyltransferase